ncbi:MAG: glycoside hydrolase family 15 protein [Chloroflexi bacterium]|nr:glycoside hydrolase family 15 protein [Chloroflexota bacterium]
MMDLFQYSIHIILTNQAPTGAYIASPNFPTYHYSWFRDGAFIAYAMDLVDEHESARRFHDWAAHTILRHAHKARRAIEKVRSGQPLGEDNLHTRYTLEGHEAQGDWPNFQLDGLGTWLWALGQHIQLTDSPLPTNWKTAVSLVTHYLTTLWSQPCYDLWEEHPNYLHPYTLAAIYAGLRAANALLPEMGAQTSAAPEEIRRFVLTQGIKDGHLVKSIALQPEAEGDCLSEVVDASLLGIAVPYGLLAPGDPIMQATVTRIESDLRRDGGGVHRYPGDTYYGGGEWVLLSAWLGWYYAVVGNIEHARSLQTWVEEQANLNGELPEQVPVSLNDPAQYHPWVQRWGPIAQPLLWSHANYLILRSVLERTPGRSR